MIEPLLKAIEPLVVEELARANEQFPQFHSPHEGWAVICEEVEEATMDMVKIDSLNQALKREVFCDNEEDANKQIEDMRKLAVALAAEAIQVAAMCDKYKFMEVDNGDKQ
jgi:hypothetical protein